MSHARPKPVPLPPPPASRELPESFASRALWAVTIVFTVLSIALGVFGFVLSIARCF
jgi:hypothetical protein